MVDFSECTRKSFCVYCDDPDCIHAGDIEADCPKWRCDNNPIMDCENCEFLREYKEAMMNHDYANCLDYSSECPKECFRGKLIRDLRENNTINLIGVPIAWAHLKGTEECKKKEVTE